MRGSQHSTDLLCHLDLNSIDFFFFNEENNFLIKGRKNSNLEDILWIYTDLASNLFSITS